MSLFTKKSSPKYDDQESHVPQKSKGSLIVLLILLGGFAYLYFFTSLIVPHETEPAKAPVGAPEIKSTMPPKSTAQPAPLTPLAPETKKTETAPTAGPAAPATTAPAVAKPVAPAAPAPQAAAKPVAPVAAPKTPAAAPAPLPPPQAAVKKESAAPVKTAQPVPRKEEPKGVKAAAAPEKRAARKAVSYTIFAGEFPAGDETAAVEAKLAKLAVKNVVKNEVKKSRTTNRLYYGVYSDYDAYLSALEKVRQSSKGAFGVEKDGKYYVYAGSFSSRERAEKEKKDLSAKGLVLLTQQVVIPLSTVRITAGLFSSKAEADKTAARMKSEGLAVKVIPKGR